MNPIAPFYTLAYADSELIFVTHSGRPALFYWGPKLDLLTHSFEQLAAEQHSEPPALPPMPSNVSLCPLLGDDKKRHFFTLKAENHPNRQIVVDLPPEGSYSAPLASKPSFVYYFGR